MGSTVELLKLELQQFPFELLKFEPEWNAGAQTLPVPVAARAVDRASRPSGSRFLCD